RNHSDSVLNAYASNRLLYSPKILQTFDANHQGLKIKRPGLPEMSFMTVFCRFTLSIPKR
ncbi:hypothetical protein WG66_008173, partial [Moniliophthora roreri]